MTRLIPVSAVAITAIAIAGLAQGQTPAVAGPGEAAPAAAGTAPTTVSIRWENDVIAGTDDNYSNGFSIAVSREGPGPVGGLWNWMGVAGGRRSTSYEVGQLIVTPRDISRTIPDPGDRPYAGLLYVAVSTQLVRSTRFDGVELITGVVGPAAGAAETQRAFHRVSGNPEPRGWAFQLKNEPILNLVYEHRERRTLVDGTWGADAIASADVMAGNVLVQAVGGAQFRAGLRVPADFGTARMRGLGTLARPLSSGREQRFGAYAFAGASANVVARNLTLDGNTFADGPRVEKRALFPSAEIGAVAWWRRLEVTFTYVFWGREYENQPHVSRFGAATVAVRF
jgi:lipid A 3-O-deacylase